MHIQKKKKLLDLNLSCTSPQCHIKIHWLFVLNMVKIKVNSRRAMETRRVYKKSHVIKHYASSIRKALLFKSANIKDFAQ